MELMIIIACSIVSSWFFTASIPSNDTIKEILVGTWLLACLSAWISLIIYSIWDNVTTCSGIALLSGALWKNEATKIAKRTLNKIINDKIEGKKKE